MWSELPRRARGGGGATTTGGSHCVVPDPVLWKYVSPLVWGVGVGVWGSQLGFGGFEVVDRVLRVQKA